MISERAIDEYLARKLKNSDRAKEFSVEVIDSIIEERYGPNCFKTPPKLHQRVCFLLGMKHPGYLMWLDPGLGKTKLSLDLIAAFRQRLNLHGALVLMPYSSILDEWVDQVAEHRPDLKILSVEGSPEDRRSILFERRRPGQTERVDVVVCTYLGFLQLVSRKVRRRVGKQIRNVLEPASDLLREISEMYSVLIMDEISGLTSPNSALFFALNSLEVPKRIGLTGTPFGSDPQALWTQFQLTDRGETFGPLGVFRGAFFRGVRSRFHRGMEYHLREDRKPLLYRFCRHRAIRYAEEEALDMPKVVGGLLSPDGFMTRRVAFSEETWRYYKKLVNDLKEAKGNFRVVENVFVRLRTLDSGWLGVIDPEGDRIEVKFKNNPKMDALIDYLREIPEEKSVVVAHVYQGTGALLEERFGREKIKFACIRGGMSKKARSEARRLFREKKVRVLLLSEAGTYGLNLQKTAHFMAVYESPSSPDKRVQLEKRLARQGQEKIVRICDFVVKTGISEKILRSLRAGRDLFDEIVEGHKRSRK